MKRRHKICPHCKCEIEVEFIKEFGDDFRIEKARADERAKIIEEVRDAMTYNKKGLSGYYTISEEEWERICSRK